MKQTKYTDSQVLRDALAFHNISLTGLIDTLLSMFIAGNIDTFTVLGLYAKRRKAIGDKLKLNLKQYKKTTT